MTDFIRTPANPPPPGGEIVEFLAADGVGLRAAVFERAGARGGVLVAPGRVEFIEKYFEVVSDLMARGFSAAVLDWRGQGRSGRMLAAAERGHVRDFADYRADLRLFTEDIARKRLKGPLVLMTHSMGGAPALQLLADGYDAFAAAILCAPMTRLFADPFMRGFARIMADAACTVGAGGQTLVGVKEHSMTFEGNVLTSDRGRHARFRQLQEAAPDAVVRDPTYGWLKAANAAMSDLHRPGRFAKLTTPTLIVSAEHDHLVDSGDHAFIAQQSPLIERVVIKGALHEIMMEQDPIRAAYWQSVDDFLARKLPATTAV
jgi:lysophospholipase